MTQSIIHPLLETITEHRGKLTPKGRILGDYIIGNPKKAVFMTIRELAEASGVSEATVVRFVNQLGYGGYGEFMQSLRDILNTGLTLPDRMELKGLTGANDGRFRQAVYEEMDNLRRMYESMDMERVDRVVKLLDEYGTVYVIGSRLSYTLAYYLGWALTKIRQNTHIIKGSDSTVVDHLVIAPENTLVVVIATTRYPNELLRICKQVRHIGHKLVVLTDSMACPMIRFAHEPIVAKSRHIPFIGSPTSLSCLINYMLQELAGLRGEDLKSHQQKLEQAYRENDILFNM